MAKKEKTKAEEALNQEATVEDTATEAVSDETVEAAEESAEDKAEAEKKVCIGDAAGFISDFVETETAVMTKALDNRVGCYVLLEALKKAQDTENEVYAVFTVQEELGLRGAGVAAHAICPDMAIALDVTDTGDTPGAETMHVKLGGGAAVKIKDSGILSHPAVVSALVEQM